MAHLSLSLLGGFTATLDEEPIAGFESAKVRALLAFLAVEADRPHRREMLAALLWPDRPDAAARNNLRHALAVLRKAIGDRTAAPPFLLIDGETIQFNRASDHVLDVEVLQNLLAHRHDECVVNRLQHVPSLYQGPFIEGFFLKDSPMFDDWSLIVRERVERKALEALRRLVDEYEAQAEYEQACEVAHRRVELAPWHEEAHRRVMRLLARTGQRSAALAQYEACRRALAAELSAEPAGETTTLYERIRDGELLHDVAPGLERTGPRSRTARAASLPAQVTPLIGRETELAALARMLRDPHCRLVTLVGPGGIGKTHLGLEAARSVAPDAVSLPADSPFADGACLASLAGVASVDGIVAAVANAAGLTLNAGPAAPTALSPRQRLFDFLRERRLLLALDNLEHLLDRSPSNGGDAAAFVVDLLANAPHVKILATSRVRLDVPLESLFTVSALDFPTDRLDGRAPSAAAAALLAGSIAQHSAVRLFLAAARRTAPDFPATDSDLAHAGEVCRLVQGNPLAVLLAASWIGVLSPAEIANEVAGEFSSLKTAERGIPERHRSMRAVLDHSWRLLTEQERTVAAALSVFRGGFTRQAARYVTGATPEILRSLISRSLVQLARMSADRGAPGRRFEMHELLRQYAAERLGQSPVTRLGAYDRHSEYFVAALQAWGEDLKGPRQREALAEMDLEIDNARAAWDWASEQERVVDLARAAEGLGRYYEIRLRWQEGVAAFRGATEMLGAAEYLETDGPGDTIATIARVLAYQALFAQGLGETEKAHDLLVQGLNLVSAAEGTGPDTRSEAALLWYLLGQLGRRTGRFEIRKPYERSLELYRSLDDPWGTARALCALGQIDNETGDPEGAKRRLEEGAVISRAAGDVRGVAEATRWLSWVHTFQGELEEGERTAREAVSSLRSLGDRAGVAWALTDLASDLWWAGRYAESQSQLEEHVAVIDDLGLRSSFGLLALAWVGMHQGRYQEARCHIDQATAIAREADALQLVGDGLHQLGHLALREGAYAEARRLVEDALAMYRTLGLQQASAVVQSVLAHAARGLGDPQQARNHIARAARTGIDRGALPSLAYSLPVAALLLLDEGKTERALEAWASALRLPCVANSRWFEDVVGLRIEAAADALPAELAAAARERGRARDPQATLRAVVDELTGEL